ncbi:MAG: hypothetical protein MZV64_70595 [Ignavibacteriales bacterium]|nr:hypothetical protein [Ignavibacteriales bacterium]
MGATRKSCTSTPAERNPLIRARLMRRQVRCGSRLAHTMACSRSVAPKAAPSFAANSGEISTFPRPVMPYPPKSRRAHRSPQTKLAERIAPSSTSFWGQTLTSALTTEPSPMQQSSLTRAPSKSLARALTSLRRPMTFSVRTAPAPMRT